MAIYGQALDSSIEGGSITGSGHVKPFSSCLKVDFRQTLSRFNGWRLGAKDSRALEKKGQSTSQNTGV